MHTSCDDLYHWHFTVYWYEIILSIDSCTLYCISSRADSSKEWPALITVPECLAHGYIQYSDI